MAKEIICQHHVLNNCLLCACCLHWWAGSRAGGDPDEWALALPPEERQSCTCFILRQDLEELGERCWQTRGSDVCVWVSKQGAVPGRRTWRNLHVGGGLDLDFEGALGLGCKETEENNRMRKARDLLYVQFSSVQFSRSVVSDSLPPHGLQHARPPCPSITSDRKSVV